MGVTIHCDKHGLVGTLVLTDGKAYCPYCGFPELNDSDDDA